MTTYDVYWMLSMLGCMIIFSMIDYGRGVAVYVMYMLALAVVITGTWGIATYDTISQKDLTKDVAMTNVPAQGIYVSPAVIQRVYKDGKLDKIELVQQPKSL